MSDNELEHFKSNISLSQYAESTGWTLDRKKSSNRVKVYRTGPDKILVWTGQDGHDVYRNERDHSEHGSVIDFVMKQDGCSLGRARVALRAYLGTSKPPSPPCPKKLSEPTSQGQDGYRKKAKAVWYSGKWNPEPDYLLDRGLSRETLSEPRFMDTFRQSRRGDMIFPHRDRDGFTGYEIRRHGFNGFGERTFKALWLTRNFRDAKSIVLCESSVNALSHWQLHKFDSAYVSIAGTVSALQRDLLTGLLLKAANRGVKVYSGFDNDPSGDRYHEMMQLLSPEPLERLLPRFNDWNEDLLNGYLYKMWKVYFADGHTMTLIEPEPTGYADAWRYANSLTGTVSIKPVGKPAA